MVQEPFLIHPKRGYQDYLHVSVLTLFRQALLRLAGGMLKRTGHSSFGQVRPLFTNLLEYRGDVNCQIHVLWQRGYIWPAPGTNIRLIWSVWATFCLEDISLPDRSINTFNFREGDEELKSFPSSRPTNLCTCMWLNRSTGTICPPPLQPV